MDWPTVENGISEFPRLYVNNTHNETKKGVCASKR